MENMDSNTSTSVVDNYISEKLNKQIDDLVKQIIREKASMPLVFNLISETYKYWTGFGSMQYWYGNGSDFNTAKPVQKAHKLM